MTPGASSLRGVICHDDARTRLAVHVIMERCGFEVAAETEGARQVLTAAQLLRPDAVVLDLALSGRQGLRLVPALVDASRRCSVVVLSPFLGLRPRALELGAAELLGSHDLRLLERTLHRVGTIPAGCSCWLNQEADGGPDPGVPDSARAPSVRHYHQPRGPERSGRPHGGGRRRRGPRT